MPVSRLSRLSRRPPWSSINVHDDRGLNADTCVQFGTRFNQPNSVVASFGRARIGETAPTRGDRQEGPRPRRQPGKLSIPLPMHDDDAPPPSPPPTHMRCAMPAACQINLPFVGRSKATGSLRANGQPSTTGPTTNGAMCCWVRVRRHIRLVATAVTAPPQKDATLRCLPARDSVALALSGAHGGEPQPPTDSTLTHHHGSIPRPILPSCGSRPPGARSPPLSPSCVPFSESSKFLPPGLCVLLERPLFMAYPTDH